jgi:hypothetical protein
MTDYLESKASEVEKFSVEIVVRDWRSQIFTDQMNQFVRILARCWNANLQQKSKFQFHTNNVVVTNVALHLSGLSQRNYLPFQANCSTCESACKRVSG